jgi:DNA-binding Xre family transcriptional regulator
VRARRTVHYSWRLREVMAAHGIWKTTELKPLLAERGVELSAAQVYRLATGTPERLSLATLAALCDIFDCTPADLIETAGATGAPATKAAPGRPVARRPCRARITDDHQQ